MGRIVGITYTSTKPAEDEQKKAGNAGTVAADNSAAQPEQPAPEPVIPDDEPEEAPEPDEPEPKTAKRAGRR